MEIHHSKHHQAYVTNLNAAIEKAKLEIKNFEQLENILKDLEQVPQEVRMAVRNNGGGHFNHTFFWNVIDPSNRGVISQELLAMINTHFESFEQFTGLFSNAAMTRFGSGWAWLVQDNKTKSLEVISTANQDTPLELDKTPLIGLDVWEHAYYLKYQNLRANYVADFMENINWNFVNQQLVK